MTVQFLEVRFDQCRTPRWRDSRTTPLGEMMVCGAPVIAGRTYCADCRQVLIAGELRSDGSVKWFAQVDERAAGEALRAAGEVFGRTIRSNELRVAEPKELDADRLDEGAEPEGARPLFLSVMSPKAASEREIAV